VAVAIASSSSGGSNTTSPASVSAPSGTAAGDLLVAIHIQDGDGDLTKMTAPAGWTQQSTSSGTTVTAGLGKVWTKTATSSEGPYSFAGDTDSIIVVRILRITGGNNTSPFAAVPAWFHAPNTGSGVTAIIAPTVSPSAAGLLINLWTVEGVTNGSSATITPPGGITALGNVLDPGNFYVTQVGQSSVASGATGTKTGTANNAGGTNTLGYFTMSMVLANSSGLAASGAMTPTGALRKVVVKAPFAASMTPTGALTKAKVVARVFSGAMTPIGSLLKAVPKAFAGSMTPSGVLAKRPAKNLSGSLTPAATLRRGARKFMAGSVTLSGALTYANVGRVFGRPGVAVMRLVQDAVVTIRHRRG
jgi:hypothetical protein